MCLAVPVALENRDSVVNCRGAHQRIIFSGRIVGVDAGFGHEVQIGDGRWVRFVCACFAVVYPALLLPELQRAVSGVACTPLVQARARARGSLSSIGRAQSCYTVTFIRFLSWVRAHESRKITTLPVIQREAPMSLSQAPIGLSYKYICHCRQPANQQKIFTRD